MHWVTSWLPQCQQYKSSKLQFSQQGNKAPFLHQNSILHFMHFSRISISDILTVNTLNPQVQLAEDSEECGHKYVVLSVNIDHLIKFSTSFVLVYKF